MNSTPGPIDPPTRLLMGPGPINADPRVLRAFSAQLVGQYDPWMRECMAETSALYRQVFKTANEQTLLVDGTSRAGIEAALVSLVEPGDRVLVPVFGRFGHLLTEIAERCGAEVHTIEVPWGEVFTPEQVEAAVVEVRPKVLAVVQGDTSTTMCQPLADLGEICRRHDVLFYCDATASLGGNAFETDAWGLDVVTAGLQKCLAGPSGSAPITISPRAAGVINARKHVEAGIREEGDPELGRQIASNYFDLAMVMDYWGPRALNHHTEATTMLYGARECARLLVEEGLDAAVARHDLHGRAMLAGVRGLGLEVFGDVAHKMTNVVAVHIPDGVPGDEARGAMLTDFGIEIGTSFGPLHGKVWRIGTMGYNARKDTVLLTLAALEQVLRSYAAPGDRRRRGGRGPRGLCHRPAGRDAGAHSVGSGRSSKPRERGTSSRRAGRDPVKAADVIARCGELDAYSSLPHGLERVYLSPEHAQANALTAAWMREAGMATWQDAAGNQWGRREGHEPGLPALVLGSHLDTVPDAGSFDGMLGVLMAIAVVQRLGQKIEQSDVAQLPFALEVVGFSDEEGTRFGKALLGSQAVAGTWDDDWWELRDRHGTTLYKAFGEFGLDPRRIADAARRPDELVGYLEAHIEQGPYLEAADASLGVVTLIAGARRFRLSVLGEARHAGGTPYPRRRDALVGAAEAIVLIEQLGKAGDCIATVGRIEVRPGGINVIPGRADFSLDLRAETDAARDAMWEELSARITGLCERRGLRFEVSETHHAPAVPCAPWLQQAVTDGIRATGDPDPMALWSRAGHDAMAMGAITDVGMLFVRCLDGISHHADEDVREIDVEAGLDALEQAVLNVAATVGART